MVYAATQNSRISSNVLITGATGFIGRLLCQSLTEKGYRLWVLSRFPGRVQKIVGSAVIAVSTLDEIDDVKFWGIVNLAGKPMAESRWNKTVKQQLRDSRIGLTNQLFEWCKRRQSFPHVLVSGSAIGVYGDGGNHVLTEASNCGRDFAARLCKDWEIAAQQFEPYARVCLVRTGIVLDSGGGALRQMLPAFRMGLGGPMGQGKQFMSWIHRRDLVRLLLCCLEDSALQGPINATAPGACTNREFGAVLAACLARPARLQMPVWLLRLLFGEIADSLLLASQRVMPERILQSGFRFEYPELKQALEVSLKK
jgi:uncharacterized protein (TIGR01777 family)